MTVVHESWPDVTPPVAPCEPHRLEQLGRTRVDDYAWMKFIPESGPRTMENLPARLSAHLHAEMAYADAMLRPLANDIAAFRERFIARSNETVDLVATCRNGSRYESELPEGAVHRRFKRMAAEGKTEVLFDEGDRASGHAYYRATGHQPSPDDRYFAWAEDLIGDDRHRICVLDRASGAIRTIVDTDAFGYGGFTFSPSSRYVFWIWRDEHSRPTRLYRTSVDEGATVLVYEEQDPSLFMQIGRTAADGFVVLTLIGPDVSEVRIIAAGDELAVPRVLQPRNRGTRYQVNEWRGELIMLTTADGAADGRLVTLDSSTFAEGRELVAHRAGHPILVVQPFADALVRLERVEGLHQLVVLAADGQEWQVAFDEPAYSIEIVPGQAYQSTQVRIVHQSPATMRRWIDVDLATGEQHLIRQDQLDGFDPQAYRIERLYAQADDGETIPITVLSKKDAEGPLPTCFLPATARMDFRSIRFFAARNGLGGCRVSLCHRPRARRVGKRPALVPGRMPREKAQLHDRLHCLCATFAGYRLRGEGQDRGARHIGGRPAGLWRHEYCAGIMGRRDRRSPVRRHAKHHERRRSSACAAAAPRLGRSARRSKSI